MKANFFRALCFSSRGVQQEDGSASTSKSSSASKRSSVSEPKSMCKSSLPPTPPSATGVCRPPEYHEHGATLGLECMLVSKPPVLYDYSQSSALQTPQPGQPSVETRCYHLTVFRFVDSGAVKKSYQLNSWVEIGDNTHIRGDISTTKGMTIFGSPQIDGKLEAASFGVLSNALITSEMRARDRICLESGKISGKVTSKLAYIYGNCTVSGDVHVHGDLHLYDDACLAGNVHVGGNLIMYDNARIAGKTYVAGHANVWENTSVIGPITIKGSMRVGSAACVARKPIVGGKIIYGVAADKAYVAGHSRIVDPGISLGG